MIGSLFFALALAAATTIDDDMAALAAVDSAMTNWKLCAATATRKYSYSSTEPAQTVVEASIGECAADLQKVRTALYRTGSSPVEADDMIKHMVDYWRPILTAGVLRLRAAQPRR